MNLGWTGSLRSKNSMLNGNVVSLPAGQAWMTWLHRKVITISSFFCGHTRSSRVVMPGLPANGGPISPTISGWLGWAMLRINMPGGTWVHPVLPSGQVLEAALRLPTYRKFPKIAGAAFIPRWYRGFFPTSSKLLEVPGMAGGTPDAATARDGAAVAAVTSAAAVSASRSLDRMIPPRRSDLPPVPDPSSSFPLRAQRLGAFPS